mgnify:CR=1 FL=1
MHLSEDDIRTKVVNEWLKSCGLSYNQILIEKTIKIQLGRGVKTINSRTDILIRNEKRQNLIIIEVKKPTHKIVDADKKQALSYARSLIDGIAPFTILTNGNKSYLYDSVTGDLINDKAIPSNHPHIISNFIATGNSIITRMEALEYLISLSEENLLAFCKAQVEDRLKCLKGTDLNCGKKYIPQLYVERRKIYDDLKLKIFGDIQKSIKPRNLVLIVGPPQQGKTCFVCNSVERLLIDKHPVLFFPAINLTKGLIKSIQEDLEWTFNETLSETHCIKKLNEIGKKVKKKLLIFVDGWNEMEREAIHINEECKKLGLDYITIVISTTSPSLQRLLRDSSDNPTYISEKTNINSPQLKKLISEPLVDTSKLGIVQIGKFNETETNLAKQLYSKTYNVTFSEEHMMLSDPFYIRIASEQYANSEIPDKITKTQLIRNSLINKGRRRGVSDINLLSGLNELAEYFLKGGRPLSILNIPSKFQNEKQLNLWVESAILTLVHSEQEPSLDFYYTHDLDFSIGELYRNWSKSLNQRNENNITKELLDSTSTETGRSALRWFLGLPENSDILKNIFKTIQFNSCFDTLYGKILSESIVKQVTLNNQIGFEWLEDYLDKLLALETNSNSHIGELPELIFSFLMSFDWEKKPESYKFWMSLLIKYDDSIDELGFHECYIHQVYGETIERFDGHLDTSLDVDLFELFLFDLDIDVVNRAGYFLAYACPYYYLEKLIPKLAKNYVNKLDDLQGVLEYTCPQIINQIMDNYYGGMCPGWLSSVENGSEEIKEEFFNQKRIWFPVMKLIETNSNLYKLIKTHLTELRDYAQISLEDDDKIPFRDPNQLNFNF